MAYIIVVSRQGILHPVFINCITSHSMESDVMDGVVLGRA